MQIRDLVREDIRNLVPYEPHPYADVIKLDANENPHAFPAPVIKDIFETLTGDTFTRYPDPLGEELRGEIGKMTGAAPENIILGNGSDELIQLLLQTFGGPGRRVVIPAPTFAMYKIHGQITELSLWRFPGTAIFLSMRRNLLLKCRFRALQQHLLPHPIIRQAPLYLRNRCAGSWTG